MSLIKYSLAEAKSLFESLSKQDVFLLMDENTFTHCLPKVQEYINIETEKQIILPAGEAHKSIESCNIIWSHLLNQNASKNTTLINLGGGMISDIGAFAASTFKRGISFINIPTTSLAMIDACYGGKNGINFAQAKNQIGTFNNAEAILIDPIFLSTLSSRHIKNGFVESIKHQLLFNHSAFEEIERIKDIPTACTTDWMKRSLEYKISIVAKDPFDCKERQALNFGHTIGHALESFALKSKIDLYHGEAVLLGMIDELKIAEHLFNITPSIRTSLTNFKEQHFSDLSINYSLKDLIPYLLKDKKNNQQITFSLIKKCGEPIIGIEQSAEELTTCIQ